MALDSVSSGFNRIFEFLANISFGFGHKNVFGRTLLKYKNNLNQISYAWAKFIKKNANVMKLNK